MTYDDHGTVRNIAHRLSFAEMVVPYRDSSFDHYRRTAYDIGEWGLGYMATSLELGCDCLGEIVYVDATLSDTRGEPYEIKNAICLHEEDNAVLWKHVDHRTYAPYHQHFLVARLDLDVDGDGNTVLEVDSEALPVSAEYPYGLAVRTVATPIRSEAESGRDFDWARQRTWAVVNPNKTNKVGGPPAYKLVPSASIPPMMDPETVQFLRAPVIGHTLWVTREHEDERWPAGAYPTQSYADDGMSRWIADDESLVNTDVVLWYVFGIHHITRMEEWPIMSADVVSFWLKPSGFFDQNPAIDVAASSTSSEQRDGTCH